MNLPLFLSLFLSLLLSLFLPLHVALPFQGQNYTKLILYRNDLWNISTISRMGGDGHLTEKDMTPCADAPHYFYSYLASSSYKTGLYFFNKESASFDLQNCNYEAFQMYRLNFDGKAAFLNSSQCIYSATGGDTFSSANVTLDDYDFVSHLGICAGALTAPLSFPETLPTTPPPMTSTTSSTPTQTETSTPGPTQMPFVGDLLGPEPQDWWVWVIVGVGAAMVLSFYLALRKVRKEADNIYFLIFFASLFNAATDIAFVVELATMLGESRNNPLNFPPDLNLESLAAAAIVFLVVPAALNVITVFWLLIAELRADAAFYAWFEKHHVVTAAMTVVAFCNIHVLNLLNSQIVGWGIFTSSWSEQTTHKILIVGLVGHVVKDLPQLVLQAVVSTSMRRWNTIFLLSTLGTLFALCLGLIVLGNMIWKHYNPPIERTNSYPVSEKGAE